MGVADAMKEKFKDQLNLQIYAADSKEASGYNLKSSTAVYVNQELVSLDVFTSKEKMENYLNQISSSS